MAGPSVCIAQIRFICQSWWAGGRQGGRMRRGRRLHTHRSERGICGEETRGGNKDVGQQLPAVPQQPPRGLTLKSLHHPPCLQISPSPKRHHTFSALVQILVPCFTKGSSSRIFATRGLVFKRIMFLGKQACNLNSSGVYGQMGPPAH